MSDEDVDPYAEGFEPSPNARSTMQIVGILSVLFWSLAALGSVVPVLLSAMIFDAPGSEDNPLTQGLFVSLCSFPILAAVSAVATPLAASAANRAPTLARHRALTKQAWIFALLPLVSAVLFGVFLVLLQAVCGGSFSCR